MTAICATCKSWTIKTSWLKAANMAPCDLKARYTALPPTHACELHRPLEPDLFAKRLAWLEQLDAKHTKGKK